MLSKQLISTKLWFKEKIFNISYYYIYKFQLTSRLYFQFPVDGEVANLIVDKAGVICVIFGTRLVYHDHGLPDINPLPLPLPISLLHPLAVLVEAELGLGVALAATIQSHNVVVLGPQGFVSELNVLLLQYWGESSCEYWKLY